MWAALLLLLLLPLLGTYFARLGPAAPARRPVATSARPLPAQVPPVVEPARILELPPEEARTINAGIPFSTAPNPAARPFRFAGGGEDQARALDCLAAAQYYEAGDDPVGQKAVAQVVLNRLRHPAFPKTICGVVFQGAERDSGCQFTFTCDGAMARTPSAAAWDRARSLARRMMSGLVEKKVGYATHYHTDWVVPYWSASLDKIAEVHTHLFFRWPGWWGTPGAFRTAAGGPEPHIASLARLSPPHAGGLLTAPQMTASAEDLADAPQQVEGGARFVQLSGGARMVATSPEGDAFVVQLPWDMATGQYVMIARTFCSGRTKCRIMGWRAGESVPRTFPITPASLSSMIFSYIHNADNGLQRLLWNCDKIPQDNPRNCMRERVSMGKLAEAVRPPSPK